MRQPLLLDGYIRVSQVRGRKGESFISPDVQREEIGRWMSANRAVPGKMFEELNKSGGQASRPRLIEAVERIESGESDGIVVAKLNRFGRSFQHGLSLIARIQEAGGTLVSVQQGFDLRTPTGQLVMRIFFAFADWELAERREGWNISRSKAIGRGVYICRKGPIGYTKTKRGHLAIHPVEGPIIRELFVRRLAGASVRELVEFLNQSKIETESGVPFAETRVYNILKNPAYRGVAHSGHYSNPDAHEPLIDAASWQKCQSAPRAPKKWVEALASGMIRCACCGSMMTSIRSSGKKTRANVYRCCASRGECERPAQARGDELDPLVEEFLFRHSRIGRKAGSGLQRERAEAAVARAQEDLSAYRDNIPLQRTLGPESFEAGLAKRSSVVERKLLELARVKKAGGVPDVDLKALERDWPGLCWDERRRALANLLDLIVVERGSAPVIERAWIYRKGRGPVASGRRRRIEFKAPPEGTARLKEHHFWGEERIGAQLRAFFADREKVWPTYLEFAKAGYGRLYAQVMEWGGPYYWGSRAGFKIPGCTMRWDHRRLRGALRPFLADKERWPGSAEFRDAGLAPLYYAARNNGGFGYWAEQFGVPYVPGNGVGRRRWPKQRVERELGEFVKGHQVFPTKSDFDAVGKGRLYGALVTHGGLAYWASHFGLPTRAGALDRRKSAVAEI